MVRSPWLRQRQERQRKTIRVLPVFLKPQEVVERYRSGVSERNPCVTGIRCGSGHRSLRSVSHPERSGAAGYRRCEVLTRQSRGLLYFIAGPDQRASTSTRYCVTNVSLARKACVVGVPDRAMGLSAAAVPGPRPKGEQTGSTQWQDAALVDHLIDGQHLGEGRAEHGAGRPLEHVPRHAIRVDGGGAVAEEEDPEVAAPGGICVSEAIYTQVRDRLSLDSWTWASTR